MGDPLLEARGLSKQFPGVRALDDVCLSLNNGEVLAVIGENGAGKSTLMKILGGVQRPDRGTVLLQGEKVAIDSVRTAAKLGIALIHQELNLADNLDIGANIFLGREPLRWGLTDRRTIDRESAKMIAPLGLDSSPRTLVSRLSIGQQQLVEIAKALATEARILIMDEPTSSLSQHETEHLYRVIRELRARGVSVLYISHRLGEVKTLADRVVVLRDGKNAGELARDEISHDAMVRLMVGRGMTLSREQEPLVPGETLLEVDGVSSPRFPREPVSFGVRAGEIVGVAGLVGAGRTELLRTLFGITPARRGAIRIAGAAHAIRSPIDAIRAGVALVPEDRKAQGLILEMAVRENLSLAALGREGRRGFLDRRREVSLSRELVQRLNIRTPSDRQEVQLLSGGNQQKVVLGKWLAIRPRILLLDEPTRGVDVGAKREIYRIMERLVTEGAGILFVSSDLEEILNMSDRALVMHDGRVTGELTRAELSEAAVMRLATAPKVA